jgi:hypothetical protein
MRDTHDTPLDRASDAEVFQALLVIADTLGARYTYAHRGRYHFTIRDDWTIALSADSAHRFRLETCRATTPRDTLWVLVDDADRLAGLVSDMRAAINTGEVATHD